MKVVLASNSPRRKELLKKIFSDFIIAPSNIDESYDETLTVEQIPIFIARKKAKNVAVNYPDSLIISADTIVVVDNHILGKPDSTNTARKMLETLSNKTHSVITGVSIIYQNQQIDFFEQTYITFKKLTAHEIEEYISLDEPYDKAGGYAIQGVAGKFVKKIDGDYENVVGLPVKKLKDILNNLGC